jgi:ABC-2 type transport system permease protein
MFLSLAANAVASLVYSGERVQTTMDLVEEYRFSVALNRISPYYLFAEVTSVLMNPNVRSLDIMSVLESQNGAVASYLTLGQSLLQIWPHLVAMIAEALAGFTAAYIAFMKQEIRA